MGLVRGMARTAVIAGTATAVSNRVSRRQAGRWQQQSDAQAYEQQQAYGAPPPQYSPPPPQYSPPPAPAPAAAAPASGAGGDLAAQLDQLAALNRQGILTDDEFAAAKAKLLGI
jgi:hypothetical protein